MKDDIYVKDHTEEVKGNKVVHRFTAPMTSDYSITVNGEAKTFKLDQGDTMQYEVEENGKITSAEVLKTVKIIPL